MLRPLNVVGRYLARFLGEIEGIVGRQSQLSPGNCYRKTFTNLQREEAAAPTGFFV
jgi:hypothetical protein